MIISIVGSRSLEDYDFFRNKLKEKFPDLSVIEKIVSGGCSRGADKFAERFARENNIPIEIILANWDKYGKKAGMIRNTEIVHKCNNLVAFWDGKSPGTADDIKKAKLFSKNIEIILFHVKIIYT